MSVILAHPDPKSFNHAIAQTVVGQLEGNGHDAFLHDLYAENFQPLLTDKELLKDALLPTAIRRHCEEIGQAEGIVIIHPNWWGQPPAILKGWIDRVIRPGMAYEFLDGDSGEGIPKGLLKAKAAVVLNTSNTNRKEKGILSETRLKQFGETACLVCAVSALSTAERLVSLSRARKTKERSGLTR